MPKFINLDITIMLDKSLIIEIYIFFIIYLEFQYNQYKVIYINCKSIKELFK